MEKKDMQLHLSPVPLMSEGMTAGLIFPDPLGSYTGVPENPDEKPQQDADDL